MNIYNILYNILKLQYCIFSNVKSICNHVKTDIVPISQNEYIYKITTNCNNDPPYVRTTMNRMPLEGN